MKNKKTIEELFAEAMEEEVSAEKYVETAIHDLLEKKKEYQKEIKRIDNTIEMFKQLLELHAKWEELINK